MNYEGHQKSDIRPLSKLAYAEGFEGDAERRTAAYSNSVTDSSTASLSKSPAEVEFRKRSIVFTSNLAESTVESLINRCAKVTNICVALEMVLIRCCRSGLFYIVKENGITSDPNSG